jgi:hypothetical protein
MELDQRGFTKDTRPNLFHSPAFGSEYNAAHNAYVPPVKDSYPAKDVRYPAYAGTLEDGRLVTDYRPQCSKNIRPGYQFHTKRWLIQHAEDIMDEARRRQIEWSGASLPMANTVPPHAQIVHSTPFYSEIEETNQHMGLGVMRANADAPDLFGTFTYEPTVAEMQQNRKNIAVTKVYEGGRNSKRGAF